jgi:hypothetical protein
MVADWLVAIGTLALAFIAVFQDQIRSWQFRPKLSMSIQCVPPDCHKTKFSSESTHVSANCYYFNFRVRNNGNRRAEYVEAYVSVLEKQQADGKFSQIANFLPTNLLWGQTGKPIFNAISPSMEKICNLGYIVDPSAIKFMPIAYNPSLNISDGQATFCFEVEIKSNTKSYIIGPGNYRMKIIIGSANTQPITRTIEINVTGDWYEDEQKMLKEGIGIMSL